MQQYAVYFICKLLYMFRVVSPPIIRGSYRRIYSVTGRNSHNSRPVTRTTGSSNGLNNVRCCRYGDMSR